MEDKIQLSQMELDNLILEDDELKILYYTSPIFKIIIQALLHGIDKKEIIYLFKSFCLNNEKIMNQLVEFKTKYF